MKKISLFCVICLLLTVLPGVVSADGDVKVEVTNIAEDIITISGSAPGDRVVTVIILNPGITISDVKNGADAGEIQFMDKVPTFGGKFKRDIKMRTGEAPDKTEGVFTVLVSLDGEYIYKNENFVFYSNETKLEYVDALKNDTKDELLVADGERKKLESIFKTYSLSSHELYLEANIEDIADVICNQQSRNELATPSDAGEFLNQAIVLCAFKNKSATVIKSDEISYAEVWANNDGYVHELYAERYINQLNSKGRAAVSQAMLSKSFIGAQFDDIFEEFENNMLYHLLVNNTSMGTGHIEKLLCTDYTAQYEAAGFDTRLLTSITNTKEKTAKLTSFIKNPPSNLVALATKFNKIMAENYGANNTQSGSSSGGGGGGGSSAGKVPTTGNGTGFVDETQQPTTTPKPTAPVLSIPFNDMGNTAWAEEAVEYLYKKGVINGRSETQFAPNETVTRAELVKMICTALDVENAVDGTNFTDVKSDDWFAQYVKSASAAGIINGDGDTFRPNNAITREDAALIIFRALGLEIGGEISFTDSENIADYAKEAIAAMVRDGYINGMGDGSFAPKNTLTRAQAAQLIFNAITKGGSAQ